MEDMLVCSSLFIAGAMFLALSAAIPACGTVRGVGIVDQTPLSQNAPIGPWKDEWRSPKLAERFAANGIEAEVIDASVLNDADRLRSYKAVMVLTWSPAIGPDSPSGRNIARYVRSGGVCILPLGAPPAECQNFLELKWRPLNGASIAARTLTVNSLGKKIAIPDPASTDPMEPGAWVATRDSIPPCSFVDDGTSEPRLYALDIEDGYVIHYGGTPPFDAKTRDWLVAAYSAILKGTNTQEVRAERARLAAAQRVYSPLPVAARSPIGPGNGGSSQILLDGDWELAEARSEFSPTAGDTIGSEWLTVSIPNSIPYALYKAGKTENPWWGDNNSKMQWIAQKDWYLRRRLGIPEDWRNRRIRLTFDGVDYLAGFWLDGALVGMHEGMFGGPTFDLTGKLVPGRQHELLIRISHNQAPQIKPLCLTGWTIWGNRCATTGLWQSPRLVSTGRACLEAPYVRTDSIGAKSAKLHAQARVTNNGAPASAVIRAKITETPSGKIVWQEKSSQPAPAGISYWERDIELPSPRLWWPNGMGDQPLYRLELELVVDNDPIDAIHTRFGIRTVELKRNPAAPGSPRDASCTWDADPAKEPLVYDAMRNSDESERFLFVVNGRPVYINGTNWHIADGLFAEKQTRQQWYVEAAKFAGINLFRLNAGNALYEDEEFYNLCDESGILIWQDIHVCGGRSIDAPLPVWREQLTRTVLRLRQHPCLALYCGGNEYTPYRDQFMPVLGMAREIFASYDDRPFRMSSTAGGSWHYARWDQPGVCFNAEWHFGYGFSNMSQFRRTLPADQLGAGPVGYDFAKFGDEHPLFRDRFLEWSWLIPVYWPPASWYVDLDKADVAEFVEAQQMFRADANGYAAEQMRSGFPSVGGQTFWGFNPQAPTSGWQVIDWFGQPQIAYYTMKRAHEPVHVLAKVNTNWTTPGEMFIASWYSIRPGETFRASVCAINNGTKPIRGAKIAARLLDPRMRTVLSQEWNAGTPAGGYPSEGHEIAWPVPADTPKSFYFLELTMLDSSGKRLSRQVYYFRVHQEDARALTKNGPWLKPQMAQVPTSLSAAVKEMRAISGKEVRVTVKITNTGPNPAFPVSIETEPDTISSLWSDNYLWLQPGESITVQGLIRTDMAGLDLMTPAAPLDPKSLTLKIGAWNCASLRVPVR